MRIIAGKYRSMALASVGKGDTATHLRPTSDRVRESLFNVLMGGAYGDPITGARVLDLFAGTGALGLEALSRGAAHATFVDDGRKAQALIGQNIDLCRARSETGILRRDVRRLPRNPGPPFDLVFLDPPYGKGLGEIALSCSVAENWVADNALIVWEENHVTNTPPGFTRQDQRRYGDTHIQIMRYSSEVDQVG